MNNVVSTDQISLTVIIHATVTSPCTAREYLSQGGPSTQMSWLRSEDANNYNNKNGLLFINLKIFVFECSYCL